MARFSRSDLESPRNDDEHAAPLHEDGTVPDRLGPGLPLLFVGINPDLWTSVAQAHLAHT